MGSLYGLPKVCLRSRFQRLPSTTITIMFVGSYSKTLNRIYRWPTPKTVLVVHGTQAWSPLRFSKKQAAVDG